MFIYNNGIKVAYLEDHLLPDPEDIILTDWSQNEIYELVRLIHRLHYDSYPSGSGSKKVTTLVGRLLGRKLEKGTYKSPFSYQQYSTLLSDPNSKVYLKDLFGQLNERVRDDKHFYSLLEKKTPKDNSKYIVSSFVEYFREKSFGRYLDLGTGDGKKAMAMMEGIKIKDFRVADLEQPSHCSGKRIVPKDRFILLKENEPIPLPNACVDLISCFMVLHHVRALIGFLKEIDRLLISGGYFCVREHDCINEMHEMLIDMEHAHYEEENFTEEYFLNTQSMKKWIELIEENTSLKLKHSKNEYLKPTKATRPVMMIFEKK